MNKEIIKKVHKVYLRKLNNLSIPHKKFAICFSGFSGSGKTHIAKILEKKYLGVRIRTDDLRKIIVNLFPKIKDKEKEKILDNYFVWLLENWKYLNGLLIFDKGIDRKYKKMFSILNKNHFEIFIIRLNVSKKTAFKRAFERNKGIDQHFLDQIERWINEWKEFGKKVKSDIIIRNEDKLDLEPLFKKLKNL